MQLSRRGFFRTSAFAAAAATASLSCPPELLAFTEPRRAFSAGGPIQLNSNEYAYGPWPSAVSAMQDWLSRSNRYPDTNWEEFTRTIAALHRVKPEQVLLGCGSSQILQMAANVFCKAGSNLVQATPSYEAMGHHARSTGAEVIAVKLTPGFAHDLERMGSYKHTGLIYICNPNNPTASITPRKDIEDLLRGLNSDTYVFIDEAYHHFATHSPEYVSFLDQPVNNPRVIVARTFSKIYGMAGLRIGYAVASEDIARRLRQFTTFASISNLGIAAAMAGLKDMTGLAEA